MSLKVFKDRKECICIKAVTLVVLGLTEESTTSTGFNHYRVEDSICDFDLAP